MRKPPSREFPTSMEDVLDSLTSTGKSVDELARSVVQEVLSVGRYGILIDAPTEEGGVPYAAEYNAESIVNWRVQSIGPNGREVLTRVILREEEEVETDDEFAPKTQVVYRELGLTRVLTEEELETDEFVYYQRLWEPNEEDNSRGSKENYVVRWTSIPLMFGGRSLDFIPFILCSPTGTEPNEIDNPPILDLVNVNISHYRNSADLEHGRHFTALPTAWVAGFDPKTKLLIGSTTAWIAKDPMAKAGFLEFTGAGLGHIQEGMEKKEKQMAVLGARLLEESRPGVEAAETVQLRQAGERSVLANIALSASEAVTLALRYLAMWMSPSARVEDITFELNRDFNVSGLTPQELTALMGAVQNNLMSWDTYFFNLKRGEMVPDDVDAETERELIVLGPPVRPEPSVEEEEEEETDNEGAAGEEESEEDED